MYQFLVDANRFERSVEDLVECLFGNLIDRCFYVTFLASKDGTYLPENHLVLVFP